ncbi:MAG: zf-HC2 domain-containing protein [Acidimicrobiia bacterium]|nr:zf-HC2 domain-containing protein [Acidimicrobiia bacterium]
MTHPDDLLSALLDGELTPAERRVVAAHLDGCGECRTELADLSMARTALRGLPRLELPEALLAAPITAEIETADDTVVPLRSRRRFGWAVGAAAALALAVGLVVTGDGPAPAADLDTLAEQHTARVVVDPGFVTIRMTVDE